ncbi:hypothetical protein D3C87_1732450 [compost metagenome]
MTDKARRKQLLHELRQKAKLEFEASLPMSRGQFQDLFDDLDVALQYEGCKHNHILTLKFLNSSDVKNVEDILSWLQDNGGYCDCEVLANVEGQFE